MRCATLVTFLLSSATHLAALVLRDGDRRLSLLPPPWRDRPGPPPGPPRPRLFNWQVDDEEAEDAGKEAVAGVMEGWNNLVSGVRSAVDGVSGTALAAVEGVAKGVRDVVSGAAHKAGEVISGVVDVTIFPGTNWCGPGDRATNYDDTGVFKTADQCCREHDSCPMSIAAGERKYGVKNDASYTMSLCTCDRAFYRCLNESHSFVAKNIGFMFFNVLKTKCFTYDYPQICRKESSASDDRDADDEGRVGPRSDGDNGPSHPAGNPRSPNTTDSPGQAPDLRSLCSYLMAIQRYLVRSN